VAVTTQTDHTRRQPSY